MSSWSECLPALRCATGACRRRPVLPARNGPPPRTASGRFSRSRCARRWPRGRRAAAWSQRTGDHPREVEHLEAVQRAAGGRRLHAPAAPPAADPPSAARARCARRAAAAGPAGAAACGSGGPSVRGSGPWRPARGLPSRSTSTSSQNPRSANWSKLASSSVVATGAMSSCGARASASSSALVFVAVKPADGVDGLGQQAQLELPGVQQLEERAT